jgi:hypothetical protein
VRTHLGERTEKGAANLFADLHKTAGGFVRAEERASFPLLSQKAAGDSAVPGAQAQQVSSSFDRFTDLTTTTRPIPWFRRRPSSIKAVTAVDAREFGIDEAAIREQRAAISTVPRSR